MKIFAVAILAFLESRDQNDEPIGTISECIPALIPAASMQAAAAPARVHAFERWKTEEGWSQHQANILPVTKTFYDAAFEAHNAGVLDMSDEPGQTFNFS